MLTFRNDSLAGQGKESLNVNCLHCMRYNQDDIPTVNQLFSVTLCDSLKISLKCLKKTIRLHVCSAKELKAYAPGAGP